jgi:superfamily II DNA or RNA helicase
MNAAESMVSTAELAVASAVVLRPYQVEAVARIDAELAANRATLLLLPTGCGKTIVFCEVIRRAVARGERALVLAHRGELLDQAAAKLRAAGIARVGVEKAEQRADGEPVVVASVQTLRGRRLAEIAPDAFGLVVVDEAHHAPAKGYRAVLRHFSAAKVLGVTATADRLDGKGLGAVFDSVAYEYSIRDAIRQGYLAPIAAKRVHVEGMDLSRVRTLAGDLNQGDLARALMSERCVREIAHPLCELAGDRKTVVFAVNVAHAEAVTAVLNSQRRSCARWLSGDISDAERRQVLADYRAGRFQFLANCALLTEGWDEPSVSCVAIARPTMSRALYTQMVGRGTRLYPGKRDLLVLDFVGNSGRHRLISTADVLAGQTVADDDVATAAELLAKLLPSLDALEMAEAFIAADRERAEAEAAEAERQAARANAAAYAEHPRWPDLPPAVTAFITEDVDPFAGDDDLDIGPVSDAPWARREATPRQRACLQRFGLRAPTELTAGQASAIIDMLIARAKAGFCTIKQARLLRRLGHASPEQLTKSQASRLIDEQLGRAVRGGVRRWRR